MPCPVHPFKHPSTSLDHEVKSTAVWGHIRSLYEYTMRQMMVYCVSFKQCVYNLLLQSICIEVCVVQCVMVLKASSTRFAPPPLILSRAFATPSLKSDAIPLTTSNAEALSNTKSRIGSFSGNSSFKRLCRIVALCAPSPPFTSDKGCV